MIDWGAVFADGREQQRAPCPACNRGPRDRALSITIRGPGDAVATCHRCGLAEGYRDSRTNRPARAPARPVARPACAARRDTLAPWARALWAECAPVAGEARAYLEARGCSIPPADGDLRWHPRLRHPMTGYEGPALVALLTDAIDCTSRSVARTWVLPNGSKPREAEPARLLAAGHRKAGAVCRLWGDEEVRTGLALAEGIESALTLAHGFQPCWAAVDASNLASFPLLAGVEALTVAVDHDPAGIRAAHELARRWRAEGREVRLVMADRYGADLNDLVRDAA